MNELELTAIDGANPLGFLAALGTLAVLSETNPHIKLGWHLRARWVPFLTSPSPLDKSEILTRLDKRLKGNPVAEAAERKREASQRNSDAAKKNLKEAIDELNALQLKGKELKSERARIVIPVRLRFEKRRRILLTRLKSAVQSPELALGQRPDCTIQEFRQHASAIRSAATPSDRTSADLLAAFGSEIEDSDNERIQPTPFCFITGSGHQWFLDTARQLMDVVSTAKLGEALFLPWTYTDKKLTMRWDPLDDRRYALMDRDPTASNNKSTTVWMANLLAYFALSFFPSAPVQRSSATAGWLLVAGTQAFRWPIWKSALSANAIRSILCHRALASPDPETDCRTGREELRARGIEAVFTAERIQVGNPPLHKINFSPATAL